MLLIGNGKVFTRDEANTMLENGAVVTDGKMIVEVGDYRELSAKYPDAEFVDAHGGLIMPGMVNAHHHIYSAFSRGLSLKNYNPHNFLEVLEQNWWHIDNTMNLEDSEQSAAAVYLSCIKNGVTTIFDHHASYGRTRGSLDRIAQQARKFGVKSCLCYEISDRNGREEMEAAVQENIAFARKAQETPDELAGLIGLHASFTLSDESLKYITEQNTDGFGYHVHVAEGILDQEDSLEKYGMRVVERLNRWGILGEKSVAGHAIHVNETELDILAQTKTSVVHNPQSNMNNAVGAPDILTMIKKKGIAVGLGTDGFTSDMIESLKFANILVKHREQDSQVGFMETMNMLFGTNPELANKYFAHPTGKLKPGYYADVIVMDYDVIAPIDGNNLNGHMTFGMNGNNVVTTISNGVIRMKDRKLIGIDEQAVVDAIYAQAADFHKRVNA